jgi:hypothetical protein
MVAGTAASVGVALMNDRARPRMGLTPAFAEPVFSGAATPALGSRPASLPAVGPLDLARIRELVARHLHVAAILGLGVILLAAAIPAVTAVISGRPGPALGPVQGPPEGLRPASGITGNWERAHSLALPAAGETGAALYAAAEEQYAWEVLRAMRIIAEENDAAAAAANATTTSASVASPAAPYSVNGTSGYAPGTVLTARITVYGCTGPGGGFCGNMSSGGQVFEGAAACSSDLPFGTRLTIAGDPTGRVYECLDRGALPATWVDVFFYNPSDGIAWQSIVGSTQVQVTIVN